MKLKIVRSGLFDLSLNSVNCAVKVQRPEQMLMSFTRNLIGYGDFNILTKIKRKIESISLYSIYLSWIAGNYCHRKLNDKIYLMSKSESMGWLQCSAGNNWILSKEELY